MTPGTTTPARRPYALLISGLGTAAMSLYHFFLPQIFGWKAGMRGAPAELSWALLSLNCFFSTLLLLVGLIAVAAWWRSGLRVASSLALAVFWCVNVAYQEIVPPPWPHKIALQLLAFAVSVAALSLWAAAAAWRSSS